MNDDLNPQLLIDRLAAGELAETDRGELFSWLDGEPSRWRRCALSLLEARELEQALGSWQAEAPPSKPTLTRAPAKPRARWGAVYALAASIVISFSLGVLARGFLMTPAPMIVASPQPASRGGNAGAAGAGTADTAAVAPQSSGDVVKPPAEPSNKTVAAVEAMPGGGASNALPPYLRSQLERRGYEVTSRQARLPVVLPDGRRMSLPVDQLQLNYVGQRTY